MFISPITGQNSSSSPKNIYFGYIGFGTAASYSQGVISHSKDLTRARKFDGKLKRFFDYFNLKKKLFDKDLILDGKQTLGKEVKRIKKLESANFNGSSKLLSGVTLKIDKLRAHGNASISGKVETKDARFAEDAILELDCRLSATERFFASGNSTVKGVVDSPFARFIDSSNVDELSVIRAQNLDFAGGTFDGTGISENFYSHNFPTIGKNANIYTKNVLAHNDIKIFGKIYTENCPEALLAKYPDNIIIQRQGWFDDYMNMLKNNYTE